MRGDRRNREGVREGVREKRKGVRGAERQREGLRGKREGIERGGALSSRFCVVRSLVMFC